MGMAVASWADKRPATGRKLGVQPPETEWRAALPRLDNMIE